MVLRVAAAMLLLAAAPLAAATPQETYNAAQAAFDRGDMAAARDGFTAVLGGMKNRSTRSAAIVAARLAAAEVALGWPERALPLVTAALAALPTGPADAEERRAALISLARTHEALIDYPAAASAWRAAIALSQGPATIEPELGLARVLVFVEPAAARAALSRARAALPADAPPTVMAQILALDGRIALVDGDFAGAAQTFAKALDLVGGLDSKVSVVDLAIRSDLSLAAFLRGKDEDGRRYLTAAGARLQVDKGMTFPVDLVSADCIPGGVPDEDDVAVIEISVTDDGRVGHVTPIYAQRGPVGQPPRGTPAQRAAAAMAMATAVREWSWKPEMIRNVPAFWRNLVRIELRCNGTGKAPAINRSLFNPAFAAWYAQQGIVPMPSMSGSDAQRVGFEKAELERRKSVYGPNSPQLIPPLVALTRNDAVPSATTRDYVARIVALLEGADAPSDLLLVSRQYVAFMESTSLEGLAEAILKLAPDIVQPGAAASRGEAYLAMQYATAQLLRHKDSAAFVPLRRIIAASTDIVAPTDPIRIAATLQLASAEAAARRPERAQALIAESGLSPDQCALANVTPILERAATSAERDYPDEVLDWGIGGRVRYGFDIDAGGKPANVRVIAAMPPFVFANVGERVVARQRYRPIYRGGTSVGCVGETSQINFRVEK